MDCTKVGQVILQLRKERGLTQQQVADVLRISNKTVSKWECGLGCPDVSLWHELSEFLGADILKILEGELEQNRVNVGKIDKVKFYVCPICRNILISTGKASITCCSRTLQPQVPQEMPLDMEVTTEKMDTDFYITFKHEMEKEHFIAFVAFAKSDQVVLNRLYPEQTAATRLPHIGHGDLYLYCTAHGLYVYPTKKVKRLI